MTSGSTNQSGDSRSAYFDDGPTQAAYEDHSATKVDNIGHSERIEFLGTMATSVAHEFNNLLSIMLSNLEQLHRQPLNERGRDQLARAEWGAQQAERLARQMLNLAGRRATEPQIIDLNRVIAEFDKIIGHAVKDGARVVLELSEGTLPAHADPAQLELVLLNLVRNASDAMSEEGSIVIRTAGHRIDGLGEKPTVEVSVSDIGSGMPPEIAQQATTSFFTTKPPGQGSGLGLWMVQRFVRECEGKLEIDTAVGKGTTVRLTLPHAE